MYQSSLYLLQGQKQSNQMDGQKRACGRREGGRKPLMETERGEETEEVGYGSAHHSADFGGRKKKKKTT